MKKFFLNIFLSGHPASFDMAYSVLRELQGRSRVEQGAQKQQQQQQGPLTSTPPPRSSSSSFLPPPPMTPSCQQAVVNSNNNASLQQLTTSNSNCTNRLLQGCNTTTGERATIDVEVSYSTKATRGRHSTWQ